MNWQRFDRIGLAFIAVVWIWKLFEYAGRQTGLLDRNLGWGFSVDFTIPVVSAASLFPLLALTRFAPTGFLPGFHPIVLAAVIIISSRNNFYNRVLQDALPLGIRPSNV